MIRRLVPLVLLWPLLGPVPSLADETGEHRYEKTLTVGDDSVRVRLSAVAFEPGAHAAYREQYRQERSRPVLGGFPSRPSVRLDGFELDWAGRRLTVPRRYYRDVFSPSLRDRLGWWDNDGGVMVRPADGGDAVLVMMETSQSGCCGYLVVWTVERDGDVTRYLDDTVP